EDGIEAYLFDGAVLSDDIAARLATTTHLVVSIAPDHGMRDANAGPDAANGSIDPVLAVADGVITRSMPKLRWIGYLSTVGVYGDHDGAWIDEQAECRPVSRRSRMRLEAENA